MGLILIAIRFPGGKVEGQDASKQFKEGGKTYEPKSTTTTTTTISLINPPSSWNPQDILCFSIRSNGCRGETGDA